MGKIYIGNKRECSKSMRCNKKNRERVGIIQIANGIPEETYKFPAPFESCKGGCDCHLQVQLSVRDNIEFLRWESQQCFLK